MAKSQDPDVELGDLSREQSDDYLKELEDLINRIPVQDGDDSPNAGSEKGDDEAVPQKHLNTNVDTGLTEMEAIQNRKRFGPNKIKEETKSEIQKFVHFFNGPIALIMILAFVIAAFVSDWITMGIIGLLLLLNAIIGYWQERRADKKVNNLKKGLINKTTVVRDDGQWTVIDTPDVVVGDIIVGEEGTVLPADCRLVRIEKPLQIDQSAITGESHAVSKSLDELCFEGSSIKAGVGFFVASAVGDQTENGKANRLVIEAASGLGHLEKVLKSIATSLMGSVAVSLFVVWTAAFFRSKKTHAIGILSLGILTIGVPVGLPAVVTTTMAVGASYLAQKGAIVKRLSTIESLAGVNILCTDKTGTLTLNELKMHTPYLMGDATEDEIILVACLAATRKLQGMEPIDKAFLQALKRHPNALDIWYRCKIDEFTHFDPVTKYASAKATTPDGQHIECIKGSPKHVLEYVRSDVSEKDAADYLAKVEEYAANGHRALGVAVKEGKAWRLLGVVPCFDPPRSDTRETIRRAQDLGLKVIMLTGDAMGIARYTAAQLGMGTNIYDAERLGVTGAGERPGSEVVDLVERCNGFSGVFPQHKYEVVRMLQDRGNLVAMTGDGVNDAPSLKKADTGIAVHGATDAARNAADIVFTDAGLSAIIDAIETSRQIFSRMYSYVVYRIALSIHLEVFLCSWIVISNTSIENELLVFNAIFADIATLAIAYDNAPISRKPTVWNLRKVWALSILMGCMLAAGTWLTLGTMLVGGPNGGLIRDSGFQQPILFLQIALTQNWLIFITRFDGPIWECRKCLPSWKLVSAIVFVDILATLFCAFGLFIGPAGLNRTSVWSIFHTYLYSFGIFLVMAFVYGMLINNENFDAVVNYGKAEKKIEEVKKDEDLSVGMKRLATEHVAAERKPGEIDPEDKYSDSPVRSESSKSASKSSSTSNPARSGKESEVTRVECRESSSNSSRRA